MISGTGQGFVTVFSTGFGPFSGSLATSTAHEHHFPYVLGREESDMALAFNRMMEIGGGHVLVNRGRIVAECRLAVGGVMSHRDIHELAGELAFLEDRLRRMGCTLERPLVRMTGIKRDKGPREGGEGVGPRGLMIGKQDEGPHKRRPVVEMVICLGKVAKKAPVNLTDRSGYQCKMLVGRSFLQEDFLVDASRKFLTKPVCQEMPEP